MARKRLVMFIAVIQVILFFTHIFIYETWMFSAVQNDAGRILWLRLVVGFLSVSFVAASLLAFRYTNAVVRAFYKVAAVWVGLLSFLFFASAFSWIIWGAVSLVGLDVNFHRIVEILFGVALVAGLYGVFNAS